MTHRWAVGLMTGTVVDGEIDVALLRTDGEEIAEVGPHTLAAYPDWLRARLLQTLEVARGWNFTGPEPALFAEVEEALTRAQAGAVDELLAGAGIAAGEVAVVGFHGQTVLHRPPRPGVTGRTRQLGDGALMARLLGLPVAYDFRSGDMAAGGQGAPLAAGYHCALLAGIGAGPETAVLNLGGVGNLTWTDGARVVAFDTGPANAPINDFAAARDRGGMDTDGALASAGRVDEARLADALADPFFARRYPKSLDRFAFTAALADGLGDADGAALLTAFAAAAVGRGLDLLPVRPERVIVCGGGRRNPALMAALEDRAGVAAVAAEAVDWRGDSVEAECFAFLAARVLRGLPLSYPATTGVPAPMGGGRLAYPS